MGNSIKETKKSWNNYKVDGRISICMRVKIFEDYENDDEFYVYIDADGTAGREKKVETVDDTANVIREYIDAI